MPDGTESLLLDPNVTWILLSSFLVALMQAGFTCLESGFVRLKNSINVAVKNLVDFCLSTVLFTIVGFGLMYGDTIGGWIGLPGPPPLDDAAPELTAYFIFQIMFCGTATTIISGAVSERMRFVGYVIVAVLIAGFIYPVAGHWVWNGIQGGEANGWLAAAGFIDFAGSTVVHSVGGWVALAAILVIGPRIGRFGRYGHRIEGHNLPMSVLGVFLLWIGFFGFNGGSTLALDATVPLIVANTALAGAAGGLAGLVASWFIWGNPIVDRVINGVIAGLVAVCAGCHLLSAETAMLTGFIAGLVAVLGMWLMERNRIDDVIGAVPSHLMAGIWGTVAVGLFAPIEALPADTRLAQLAIQLQGIVVIGAFAFGTSLVVLRLIDRVLPFRVTAEQERIGLNVAEHQATTALLDLLTQMDHQARQGDFSRTITAEPETEAAQIATFYNAVLDRFHVETQRRQRALDELARLANFDPLTGLANRRLLLQRLDQALRAGHPGALFYLDLDGFKPVNDSHGHDAGDRVLAEVADRIVQAASAATLVSRIGGDEFCLIFEGDGAVQTLERDALALIDAIAGPIDLAQTRVRLGVSIGIARFEDQRGRTSAQVIAAADEAMYQAKLEGKGTWRLA